MLRTLSQVIDDEATVLVANDEVPVLVSTPVVVEYEIFAAETRLPFPSVSCTVPAVPVATADPAPTCVHAFKPVPLEI